MARKKKDRTEQDAPQAAGKAKGPRSAKQMIREYGKAILTALVIALVLRQFVFQAFRIPTGSMLDTLQIGDFLFVNKFLYGAKTPERIRIGQWSPITGLPVLKLPAIRQPRQGDIIVFEFPQNRNLDYIKRCVAVAGDTVQVKDGVLHVNGEVYESNFGDRDGDHSCVPEWNGAGDCPAPHSRRDQAAFISTTRNHNWPWNEAEKPYVVPEGKIFMMGDNRFNSLDSRYWGALDVNLIKGKAMFIYWSWNSDRKLPRLGRIGDLIR